jgi:hypothetical protein
MIPVTKKESDCIELSWRYIYSRALSKSSDLNNDPL